MTDIEVFMLNPDNFEECKATCKNIFWMYHDMVTKYNGFGHNIDFEDINYRKFLFAEIENEDMSMFHKEVKILKHGSLVALCCEVVNLLDEERRDKKVLEFIIEARKYSQMNGFSNVESLLTIMIPALEERCPNPNDSFDWTGLEHGSVLDGALNQIYSQYVLGYFKTITHS